MIYRCIINALSLIALSVVLTGCTGATTNAPTVQIPADLPNLAPASTFAQPIGKLPVPMNEPAPDFSYTQANGETHRLSELRGKRVILNFWATWCGPCEQEMPLLQQTATDHAGQDLVVIGVNRNELPDAIIPFARSHSLTFTLVSNPIGDISDGYGVNYMPMTFFIGRDGMLIKRQIGEITPEIIQQFLDSTAKTP